MQNDSLKRTMKLHHLVIFGVAFLTPMIAYTIYGVIATMHLTVWNRAPSV